MADVVDLHSGEDAGAEAEPREDPATVLVRLERVVAKLRRYLAQVEA